MTEDEAKTKWCPAYRVATSGGEACSTYEMDNRPYNYEQSTTTDPMPVEAGLNRYGCCIASACMAWRWEHVTLTAGAEDTYKRVFTTGFCGLAGAPA